MSLMFRIYFVDCLPNDQALSLKNLTVDFVASFEIEKVFVGFDIQAFD
jgi:hypothetical protein